MPKAPPLLCLHTSPVLFPQFGRPFPSPICLTFSSSLWTLFLEVFPDPPPTWVRGPSDLGLSVFIEVQSNKVQKESLGFTVLLPPQRRS